MLIPKRIGVTGQNKEERRGLSFAVTSEIRCVTITLQSLTFNCCIERYRLAIKQSHWELCPPEILLHY